MSGGDAIQGVTPAFGLAFIRVVAWWEAAGRRAEQPCTGEQGDA